MLRLDRNQRRVLADKLPDAANAAVAALVFGQLVAGHPVSMAVAVSGTLLWVWLLACALILTEGEER
jgi:hypothetical protein